VDLFRRRTFWRCNRIWYSIQFRIQVSLSSWSARCLVLAAVLRWTLLAVELAAFVAVGYRLQGSLTRLSNYLLMSLINRLS
jgi:hypothetical protein